MTALFCASYYLQFFILRKLPYNFDALGQIKTLSEAETARRRAVTGLRNLGRDEDADRIDGLSPQQYAEEKGWEIIQNNPRRNYMPRTKSRSDLQAELDEANDYIEQLEGKLDDIAGIAGDEDDDTSTDEDGDEDSDED
jgi:hypothetical protein